MAQQSSLVLANKFNTNDIGHAHAQMVQRHFASDLSALLNCNVDIIYIKTIDETEKRLVLTESEKQFLVLESRKKFSTIMKSFPRPGRLKIIFGSPAMEISNSIKRDNTVEALIMGGSENKSMFQELIEGDVTTSVIDKISRPVFLFGQKAIEEDYSLPVNHKIRILLATDLSKEMRPTETYAISLAKRLNAKIILYHKFEYSSALMQSPALFTNVSYLPDLEIESLKNSVETEVDKKIMRLHSLGIECESFIDYSTESFHEALCSYASHRADIISLGCRKKTFLGSLITNKFKKVLNLSPVPILTVRT